MCALFKKVHTFFVQFYQLIFTYAMCIMQSIYFFFFIFILFQIAALFAAILFLCSFYAV